MNNEITINIEETLKLPDNSVSDPELSRQIGLATTRYEYVTSEVARQLNAKIKQGYEYLALYPHVMKPFGIMPDGTSPEAEKAINKILREIKDKRSLRQRILDADPDLLKAQGEEIDHLSDGEVDGMLSKYGPEGLYQIAAKLMKFADKDMSDAMNDKRF